MNCKYCKGICIKKGFQDGKQKYKCKSCKKNQRGNYTYRICSKKDEDMLIKYNNEGVSITLNITKSRSYFMNFPLYKLYELLCNHASTILNLPHETSAGTRSLIPVSCTPPPLGV